MITESLLGTDFLIKNAKEIQVVIDNNAPEIEKLDQEIGDGDHIFNVQRGIKLVIELEPIIKHLSMSKALNQIEFSNVDEDYKLEQNFTLELYQSSDSQEARDAFVEKRDAKFDNNED